MTSTATAMDTFDLNRHIGTEVWGVQLAELDAEGVEAVKQLVAQRGVLVFRDQQMDLAAQVEMGRHFGELHVHPAARAPEGFPEVLVVHTDANSKYTAGEGWHTDVSCDERPPAYSFLRVETTPPVGGDTAFASMYRAYETLSAPMQEFLCSLTAIHSSDHVYRGRYRINDQDKDFPESEHPVVRTHPISGRRALYVNSGFTRRIKGLSSRESDTLLRMLFDHIAYGVDGQVRISWTPNAVTMWDNRCVQHHASWDYFPETRHGYRVTTVGERPVL